MRTRILNILPGVRSMGKEIRRLSAENSQLQQQLEVLVAERDELKQHATRLAAAQAEWETERFALSKERDDLKQHLERINLDYIQQCWVPPGHFYSPVVAPEQVRPRLNEDPCSGIELDSRRMLDLFECIAAAYPDANFPDHQTEGWRYFFENPAFTYSDAITLFGILRRFAPERVIEIGCGYSSCLMMDANDRFFQGNIDLSFYDPYPSTVLSLLNPDDRYHSRIHKTALQDIPASSFQALQSNDILFIDSSHVAKTGSDVNDYVFRILPALRPGVLVHIHDVLFPFEYPREWILEQNRSWNEAYLIRAFLMFNQEFEIVYFNDLVYNRFRDLTLARMPLCLRNTGGSLWLRKT